MAFPVGLGEGGVDFVIGKCMGVDRAEWVSEPFDG